MKISNNFNNYNTNFKALYTKGDVFETMARLGQNVHTSEAFETAYKNIQEAAKTKDILIQSFSGTGVNVQEYDPKTKRTLNYICASEDFILGLTTAVNKLNKAKTQEIYNAEPKSRFRPFVGHESIN